ncbi:MAG: hypothetical protein MSH25_10350 [Desulfovibrio sp.]|uniref:hypothetical protein n=1 Tax=Desulfovibrio sp. TaxID=885 RepID=UPI0025BC094A|nr:hypothetical protein [Desulfovibrio sp.]MCI7569740.1 hypothetical protein [Desulfovibrio sp.]
MTFQDILARYRAVSFSERDKGDRFERLMQTFLQTVPWYAGMFRHVWPDTGKQCGPLDE